MAQVVVVNVVPGLSQLPEPFASNVALESFLLWQAAGVGVVLQEQSRRGSALLHARHVLQERTKFGTSFATLARQAPFREQAVRPASSAVQGGRQHMPQHVSPALVVPSRLQEATCAKPAFLEHSLPREAAIVQRALQEPSQQQELQPVTDVPPGDTRLTVKFAACVHQAGQWNKLSL